MKFILHKQITLEVSGVVFITMMIYALVRYGAGMNEAEVVEHLIHTAIIGVFMWFFLLWRLRRLVMDPISEVFIHGHQLSRGIFRPHDYPQLDNELDRLGDLMNHIAAHLSLVSDGSWSQHALSIEAHLATLRERRDFSLDVYGELAAILERLHLMEAAMMKTSFSQATPQGRTVEPRPDTISPADMAD